MNHKGPFPRSLAIGLGFFCRKFYLLMPHNSVTVATQSRKKNGKNLLFSSHSSIYRGLLSRSSVPKEEGSLEDFLACTSCTGPTFGPTLERKGKTQKHTPKWASFSSLVALLNSLAIVYFSESGSCFLHFEYNLETGYRGLIPSRCPW